MTFTVTHPTFYITCLTSVSDTKDLKEPVAKVIEQELGSIVGKQSITEFNTKFIEKGNNSILKRLAGTMGLKIDR